MKSAPFGTIRVLSVNRFALSITAKCFVVPALVFGLCAVGLGRPARNGPPARVVNPGKTGQLERLSRMTPEQRERALQKLPPDRRERVEQQLQRYNQLPPEQREKLQKQLETFRQLPPGQQQAIRQAFQQLNALSPDRRPKVRGAIQHLRTLSEEDRNNRLNSEQFRRRFDPHEQDIIRELSSVATED